MSIGEILKQDKVNRRTDELLAGRGMKIETMDGPTYREVMAQLKQEGLIR